MPCHPDAEEGCSDVHAAQDHGCDVRVVDANALEDRGPVVKEVVCPCELLEHLQRHGERYAVEHAGPSDGFVPGVIAGCEAHYLLDFCEFAVEHGVCFGEAVELGHGGASAGGVVVVEVVTG